MVTVPPCGWPTSCKSKVIVPQGGQHEGLRSLLRLVVVLPPAVWRSACRLAYEGMYLHVVIECGVNISSVLFLLVWTSSRRRTLEEQQRRLPALILFLKLTSRLNESKIKSYVNNSWSSCILDEPFVAHHWGLQGS